MPTTYYQLEKDYHKEKFLRVTYEYRVNILLKELKEIAGFSDLWTEDYKSKLFKLIKICESI